MGPTFHSSLTSFTFSITIHSFLASLNLSATLTCTPHGQQTHAAHTTHATHSHRYVDSLRTLTPNYPCETHTHLLINTTDTQLYQSTQQTLTSHTHKSQNLGIYTTLKS